jgi:hypothetical protein
MRRLAAAEDGRQQQASDHTARVRRELFSPVSEPETPCAEPVQSAAVDSAVLPGEFTVCILSDEEFATFLGDVVYWRLLSSPDPRRPISHVQKGRFLGTLAKLLFANQPNSTEDWIKAETEMLRKMKRAKQRTDKKCAAAKE